jgi:hypothetical protein
VQRDEDDIRDLGAEPRHQILTDVDRDRLVSEVDQRVLDSRRRAQGDPTLQRAASLQHGDPHRGLIGTTSPPGSSSSGSGAAARCSPVIVS